MPFLKVDSMIRYEGTRVPTQMQDGVRGLTGLKPVSDESVNPSHATL